MVVLLPVFAIIALAIKLESKGPVFFKHTRIGKDGKIIKIYKFRSMVDNAEDLIKNFTPEQMKEYKENYKLSNDPRVTKVGKFIRKCRLDEVSQLIDVLQGNMSFVGTRPEVTKYVEKYSPEMMATLLLPAGITSEASIRYKEEAELLEAAEDVDRVYVEEVLPGKMKYNLQSIKEFSFIGEIKTMFRTVFAVMGKDYSDEEQKSRV